MQNTNRLLQETQKTDQQATATKGSIPLEVKVLRQIIYYTVIHNLYTVIQSFTVLYTNTVSTVLLYETNRFA